MQRDFESDGGAVQCPAREFQVRFIRGVRFDVSRLAGVPGVALVLSGDWHFGMNRPIVGKRGSSWFYRIDALRNLGARGRRLPGGNRNRAA